MSFGLTESLFNFYEREGYAPVYLRQTANELTGEHSCVLLRVFSSFSLAHSQPLDCSAMPDAPSDGWLASFVADFQHRFINLLAFQFRAFPARLALRLLAKKLVLSVADAAQKDVYVKPLTDSEIRFFLSRDDLSRLESYARNYVDYHMILDTIPEISRLYFNRRFGDLSMSALQETILIGQGLQHKTIDELLSEFPKVASAQLLSLFNRSVIKIVKALQVGDSRGYSSRIR